MLNISPAVADDVLSEVGSQTEKARFLLDEILFDYFDCAFQPSDEQKKKLLVEFNRVWTKLTIIADILVRMESTVVPLLD